MSTRSIRRAAERKAAKFARKAVPQIALPNVESVVTTEPRLSDARLAANRANAQLSTGPVTDEGRAKVSLNALKSGLTGRTILLPSDDVADYQRIVDAYQGQYKPVGVEESALVQSLVDIRWRLNRVPSLEAALFVRGHIEFQGMFDHHPPAERPALIELQVIMTYEKEMRNLHIQEARLARRREKEMAELRVMQDKRKTEERERLAEATAACLLAREKGEAFNPAALGFEFSIEQIEKRLAEMAKVTRNRWLQSNPVQTAEPHAVAA